MKFRTRPALAVSLLLAFGFGCRPADEVKRPAPVTSAPHAATGVDPEAVEEPLRQALREVRDRFKCNRISGCQAATVLLGYGWKARPFLAQLFASAQSRAPWRPRALCLLAELSDPAAAPQLVEALRDHNDEVRACAIWGLWRVDDRSEEAEIRRFAGLPGDAFTATARLSARWVQHRRGEAGFGALFVQELSIRAGQSLAATPVTWGLRLCGEAGSPDCTSVLERASRHPTFVVRRAVLDLIEARPGRQHVPVLLGLLADPIPSIARRSRKALVTLSGQPEVRGVAAWRRWWQGQEANLADPATATGLSGAADR